MKSTIAALTLTTLALLPAASPVFAGPAKRADLPASASWVMHLDFDAMKSTELGKFVLEQLDKPAVQNKLSAFQAMFNFDPRTALHGVSLYSTSPRQEDGVLIVYADVDAQRLENLVKGAKDYQAKQHGSRTIHNYIDDKRGKQNGQNPRTYAAVANSRVVFGQSFDTVAAALDVMDGQKPNLASGKTFSQIGSPSAGKFLQLAGHNLSSGNGQQAALTKMAKEVRIDLGESGGQLQGSVVVQTDDKEVAGRLNDIAQGMLALSKMQTNNPVQNSLAQAFSLKQEADQIVGTFTMPTSSAIETLKSVKVKKNENKSE